MVGVGGLAQRRGSASKLLTIGNGAVGEDEGPYSAPPSWVCFVPPTLLAPAWLTQLASRKVHPRQKPSVDEIRPPQISRRLSIGSRSYEKLGHVSNNFSTWQFGSTNSVGSGKLRTSSSKTLKTPTAFLAKVNNRFRLPKLTCKRVGGFVKELSFEGLIL